MRAALKLGESPILSAAMAIPDDLVIELNTSMSFGQLSLTNMRLVFEPDQFSVRVQSREILLNDIVSLKTGWTKIFRLIPLYPTLELSTKDGSVHRFAAIAVKSIGPKRWIEAIRAAQARPPLTADANGAAEDQAAWYYESQGSRVGPLTRQELDYNAAMGKIASDTLVSEDGGPWRPASEFTIAAGARQSASPPPLAPDDRLAWMIAVVPLIGAVTELAIGGDVSPYYYFAANVLLCLFDMRRLQTAGHDAPSWWWALLIPAYLWKRSTILKTNHAFLFVWLIAIVAAVSVTIIRETSSIEAAACPLVMQIIQEQLGGTASCKKVTIVKDAGPGFHLATAILDNGNEVRITIEQRGSKEIFVQVAGQ